MALVELFTPDGKIDARQDEQGWVVKVFDAVGDWKITFEHEKLSTAYNAAIWELSPSLYAALGIKEGAT